MAVSLLPQRTLWDRGEVTKEGAAEDGLVGRADTHSHCGGFDAAGQGRRQERANAWRARTCLVKPLMGRAAVSDFRK